MNKTTAIRLNSLERRHPPPQAMSDGEFRLFAEGLLFMGLALNALHVQPLAGEEAADRIERIFRQLDAFRAANGLHPDDEAELLDLLDQRLALAPDSPDKAKALIQRWHFHEERARAGGVTTTEPAS